MIKKSILIYALFIFGMLKLKMKHPLNQYLGEYRFDVSKFVNLIGI